MNDRGPLTETTTECTNIHFHYYCNDNSAFTSGRNMSSPMMVRVRRNGAHQANNEKLKNLRREEFISHLLVQGKNICLLFLCVLQTSKIKSSFHFFSQIVHISRDSVSNLAVPSTQKRNHLQKLDIGGERSFITWDNFFCCSLIAMKQDTQKRKNDR